jgi:NAD-dependent SIR2 family protein deacetylase
VNLVVNVRRSDRLDHLNWSSARPRSAYTVVMTIIHPDVAELRKFLVDHKTVVVITGAGISASSGIPTYRDLQGLWRHSEPIKHQAFLAEHDQRKRYWTRSLLGWPAVRDARPNAAHLALARLENRGNISLLITQNVDRLHQRAGSSRVVDLHGRLDQVRCLQCSNIFAREQIQQRLMLANPRVAAVAVTPKPDGDAHVADKLVGQFMVPECEHCGGTLIPDVVFFGGTVPTQRVQACMHAVEQADAVLVVGSSLQVYSGFRFCRHAVQLGKTLAIINPGVTRADSMASVKLVSECESLLPAATDGLN